MAGDVQKVPLMKGIVQGHLEHDFTAYEHGSEFVTTDEKLFNDLRKLGALKLPHELAETAAAVMSDQAAEIELLRKQVAELEAVAKSVSAAAHKANK